MESILNKVLRFQMAHTQRLKLILHVKLSNIIRTTDYAHYSAQGVFNLSFINNHLRMYICMHAQMHML